MRAHLLSISFSFLLVPSHLFEKIKTRSFEKAKPALVNSVDHNTVSRLYDELQLSSIGLSKPAFECAYKGYQRLIKRQKLTNACILTICDLSQSSNKKRLYILDLDQNKVLMTSYVAHGRGSGGEYASRFSNSNRSHQTSLGFYITGSTYYGENGLSLRLKGIEPGINDRAARRSIVIHGAGYIGDDYLQSNKFMGRSYGCPAVPRDDCSEIIDLIKNGSCLFIYHPTKKYLQRSRILNG
ncbi:MAG TPA: murein L,D-transpeptidase catalytic domain family protein [Chitinophagaceae bacterium]|nr:murein L,D-transpeptidase catalytic domain family protein [Chitinophagaceae bacterium]